MSNRSYVIALGEQTFMHSWRVLPKTFVNSVSSKRCSWTHIASCVQQTHSAFSLTKARIGLERQRQTCAVWAKRTEYSIEQIRQSLQRLKITKIVRMQNLHNFRTIGSVFFPTHVCDTSCQSLTHAHRKLIKVGHSLRNHPPNQEDLAQFMTYEQLFICRLSNLPPPIVSIVLTKLAIVNSTTEQSLDT